MPQYTSDQIKELMKKGIYVKNTPSQPQPKNNAANGLLGQLLPLLGSIGGATLGTVAAPGLGTAAGGAAGGAAGEALRQKLAGGEADLKRVLLEGGLGAIGGGVGKGIAAVGEGGLKLGAKEAVNKLGAKFGETAIGKSFADRAAANLGGAGFTTASVENASSIGHSLPQIMQKVSGYGKNLDEILAAIPGQKKLAEDQIQRVVQAAGKDVRITGDSIINALKGSLSEEEARLLGKGGSKAKTIQSAITALEKKYGKQGITVKDALETLRKGNADFGKKVLSTDVGSATNQARKLETNAVRKVLKTNFPEIADALDSQSQLTIAQEVLGKSIAGRVAGKTPVSITGFLTAPVRSVTINRLVAEKLAGKSLATNSDIIAKSAAKIGVLPIAAGEVGTRAVAGSLGGSEPTAIDPTVGALNNALGGAEAGFQQQAAPQQQSGNLIPREAILTAMLQDLSETGGKNLSKIQLIADFANAGGSQGVELSVSQQKDFAKIGTAKVMLGQFEDALNEIGLIESGIGSRLRGAGLSLEATLGTNAKVKAYNDMRKAMSAQLAKSLGESGTLTDQDIKRAIQSIPSVSDSREEAARKLQFVRDLVDGAQRNIVNSASYGSGSATSLDNTLTALGG